MTTSLFYDDQNIFWVFKRWGAEKVVEDLEKGVFDAAQIEEAIQKCSSRFDPSYDPVLRKTLLPYVQLANHPDIVQGLQHPSGWDMREYILEKSPHLSSVLGPSFQTLDLRTLILMWDLPTLSPERRQMIEQAEALDVIMDDAVFERVVQNITAPQAFIPILFNAVYSPWSNPDTLSVLLKHIPSHIVEQNLERLLMFAAQNPKKEWPNAQQRSAEQMIDLLLPYASEETIQNWIKGEYEAGRVIQLRRTPGYVFDGYSVLMQMFEKEHMYLAPISEIECHPIQEHEEAIAERTEVVSGVYESKGIVGVHEGLKNNQFSSEEINAALYHALVKGIPTLAKVVIGHIDWNDQFAKESLRLSLGPTFSNSKQAMVQQMILKKEASELNGRLSAEIAPFIERDTDAPSRKI